MYILLRQYLTWTLMTFYTNFDLIISMAYRLNLGECVYYAYYFEFD